MATVIALHVVVFAALYATVLHFAVEAVVEAQKSISAMMLDEVEGIFRRVMSRHHNAEVRSRLNYIVRSHHSVGIGVYDAAGTLIVSTGASIEPDDAGELPALLAQKSPSTTWSTSTTGGGYRLRALSLIANERECRECHTHEGAIVGAVRMDVDLSASMGEIKNRLRRELGLVVLGWFGLMLAMAAVKERWVGRPLARIEKSISSLGGDPATPTGSSGNLDSLAGRLHETLWELLEQQRRREEASVGGMARAEQLAVLGELAAGLTHEVKNPLAAVSAAVEMLRSDSETGEQTPDRHGVYVQILQELDRVTGLLDQFLRLARPRQPRKQAIDVGPVLLNAAKLFEPRMRTRKITFEVSIAEDLPVLEIDANLISQVVLNLLTNAVQAVQVGGSVSLAATPFPQRDGVVLVVSDNGPGVVPEHVDKIFDPFFTTKENGTGLGLAICQQIVNQHSGTIRVESRPGEGSRFIVLLPALSVPIS